MLKSQAEKIMAINPKVMIVGVDVAKKVHWVISLLFFKLLLLVLALLTKSSNLLLLDIMAKLSAVTEKIRNVSTILIVSIALLIFLISLKLICPGLTKYRCVL